VPRRYCGWQHRFDDPRREYRTLPCAEQAATCLREVLADLRPNARMRAEMAETVGPDRSVDSAAGLVSRELLAAHVLLPASIDAPAQPGFADRARLASRGAPQSLSIDLADLVLVCRQFGLTLADPYTAESGFHCRRSATMTAW